MGTALAMHHILCAAKFHAAGQKLAAQFLTGVEISGHGGCI